MSNRKFYNEQARYAYEQKRTQGTPWRAVTEKRGDLVIMYKALQLDTGHVTVISNESDHIARRIGAERMQVIKAAKTGETIYLGDHPYKVVRA